MKMEWLRAGDSAPACWACFLIFDDHVDVLAVIGPNERIDGHMTLTAARKLWSDLKQRGWYHATDAEIDQHQMTHRALRRLGRRRLAEAWPIKVRLFDEQNTVACAGGEKSEN